MRKIKDKIIYWLFGEDLLETITYIRKELLIIKDVMEYREKAQAEYKEIRDILNEVILRIQGLIQYLNVEPQREVVLDEEQMPVLEKTKTIIKMVPKGKTK